MSGRGCQYGTPAMTICSLVLTTLAVLAATGSAAPVEPPTDLRFGQVRILSDSIFAQHELENAAGPLRLMRRVMNGLHVDTRESVLRRELLFATGDAYDPALLDETARNLRSLGYLNNVQVVAVDTTAAGLVDVLVTTRESWTLTTSFGYSLASGGDQRWNVKVAERNFLGYGVTAGAGIGADEDRSWWNLWYRQRRILGSNLWFGVDWSETGDGHVRSVFLSRPLFALDDARGTDASVWDLEAEPRWYLPNGGDAGVDPNSEESLYSRVPRREKGADLRSLWRLSERGQGRIWRLGGGARVVETSWAPGPDAELSDGRITDLTWAEAPGSPMARDSGIEVFPYLWRQTVGRRWTEARFVLAVWTGGGPAPGRHRRPDGRSGRAGGARLDQCRW